VQNNHSLLKHISKIAFIFLLASAFVFALILAQSTRAGRVVGFLVESDGDSGAAVATCGASDGCTLRQAITLANNSAGADTITFAGDYTITLGANLPAITSTMTIDGSGQRVNVSGNNAYRVFNINAGGDLSINNLSISDGNAGGAGGGGILNNGTLAVRNSTFLNNTAGYGGGIYNGFLVTSISNSTFSGNTTANSGGAIRIAAGYTITLMVNNTLSDNKDSLNSGGTISTFANNIIANTTVGADCANFGTITNNIKNLIEDGSCSPAFSGDPSLAPLAYNGGDTQTFALLGNAASNQAIDGGDTTTCANAPVNSLDQRGVTRPAVCDIGSFEHETSTGALTVTKLGDTDDGICNSDCSLREAVSAAGSGATIDFAVSGTITLTSLLPKIITTVTIDGSGQRVNVSGNNAYRVFNIDAGGDLSINNLSISDGNAGGAGGGGILNNGTLAVRNSTFLNNTAGYGGGIYNGFLVTSISNSTFSGNTTANSGGAIRIAAGYTITLMVNNTLSGNKDSLNSGGTISTFANNIIANTTAGADCANFGTITNNIKNLIEDGSCSPAFSGDPLLGPLTYSFGSTQVFPLLGDSGTNSAIDGGDTTICANAPVNGLDQRGLARGAACDIGAFEVLNFYFLPIIVR